ncbi:MAG: Sapep family Mn(2+)-dependent dipeptidase [Firmicutes bacterium]|nr:Sapep family Mn(2+)-dependent dipeptidase [Bacillota bacterium]
MELLEALERLVRIRSVSGRPEVSEALAEALSICNELGFRTKNCDSRIGWAEIGPSAEAAAGGPLIGILCHLDVVPPGDGWEYEPFSCTVNDGRVYGRGVMDDKGPAAAAIMALKDLLDEGGPHRGRIRIIFGCMEETGNWEDMEYYKETEEIPDFGFTPDADFPAIYGEKGIAMVSLSMKVEDAGFIDIKGGNVPNMVPDWCQAILADGTELSAAGRAAHGSTPEEGENAITGLMELAAAHDCFYARFYNSVFGRRSDGSGCGCAFSDAQSGGLTVNAGCIALEDDLVVLKADIRYPVTYSLDTVLSALKEAVAPYGVEVALLTAMAPVYMDPEGPVFSCLMSAYRSVTGDTQARPLVIGGGTYARAMKNIVAFGPVFPGRECTEHQKNEYILLEDLEKAREIYRLAIKDLCGMNSK